MNRKIALTTLATIGIFALTSIDGFSQNAANFHLPQNMGPIVNSEFADAGGFLSPNGLSFYFSSQRPGGQGLSDIWVSRRQTLSSSWQPPQNLGAVINSGANDNRPKLSPDGRTMFFGSNREGSFDICMATRIDPNDDMGWTSPINLGENVNTPGHSESTPGYFEDPVTGLAILYFSSDRDGGFGDFDIYQSRRNPDGTFGGAVNASFLNTAARDLMPQPSRDGLEIYVVSDNGGLGGLDIWVAKRPTQLSRWRRPVNVASVNTESNERDPSLSSDSAVLIFNSDRDGGFGDDDLYSATRVCSISK